MNWREARNGGNVGPGWEPLVDELHAKVLAVAPDAVVVQVKEKFGGLRYYLARETGSGEVSVLISEYERRSFKTCEWCGSTEPDVTTGSGEQGRWLKTLCPTHREAWDRDETWWR